MTSQTKQDYIIKTIEKHSDMVYRIAFSRLSKKEVAEDIYQDVFLKFSKKLPKFKSEEHKKAWFIRVTINCCNNYFNSAYVKKSTILDENIEDKNAMLNNDENGVMNEIEKLPEDYKTVIFLYYYEGYKVSEIASILSKREGTIKTWLSRARNILKENLKGGFDDEK